MMNVPRTRGTLTRRPARRSLIASLLSAMDTEAVTSFWGNAISHFASILD